MFCPSASLVIELSRFLFYDADYDPKRLYLNSQWKKWIDDWDTQIRNALTIHPLNDPNCWYSYERIKESKSIIYVRYPRFNTGPTGNSYGYNCYNTYNVVDATVHTMFNKNGKWNVGTTIYNPDSTNFTKSCIDYMIFSRDKIKSNFKDKINKIIDIGKEHK